MYPLSPLLTYHWRRFVTRLHRLCIRLHSQGWAGLGSVLQPRKVAGSATTRMQARSGTVSRNAPRILWIDDRMPRPSRDSGSLRQVNLLALLRENGYAVDFLATKGAAIDEAGDMLQQLGIGLPSMDSPTRWFMEHGRDYDFVVVSRYHLAYCWLPLVRHAAHGVHLVFDSVDLHYVREKREAQARQRRILAVAAQRTRRLELAVVEQADITWVVSPVEQSLLARIHPQARIHQVPNLHSPATPVAPRTGRKGILFIGGAGHPPNLDAARWLVDEILPAIMERMPQCMVHLVGAGLQEALADSAACPNLLLHGHVPDLRPLLEGSLAGIAPLRFGAGVKGKVNQYMAHGLPTIATACAIEGMHLQPGVDVLLADDARDFVDAIVRLHQDSDLWQQLSAAGIQNIQQHFSATALLPALESTFGPAPSRISLSGHQ